MAPSHTWHTTGFEPFLTHAKNPSMRVARALSERLNSAPGHQSIYETLPVTFECARALSRAPQSPRHTIIHVGLAADRPHISIECVGRNHCGVTPDNAGKLGGHSSKLLADAPEVVKTGLDTEALLRAMKDASSEVALPEFKLSQDAGDYVCNAIYYHSIMAHARSLFVHVPRLDDASCDLCADVLSKALLEVYG